MVQAVPAVPDSRIANKAELAQFFETSLPTIEQWVRKGCPFVQKGARGVSWVFDLLQVAEWKFSGRSSGLEDFDPDELAPSERKAWFDSEVKRRDLQVRDRELIESDEVERGIATAFATISQSIRTIPDNVERIASPGADVIEVIERITDEALNVLADQLAAMAPAGFSGEEE